jgi:hypothetical protein
MAPRFVCPDCRRSTPHPDDVENSYCPWCHQFKNESYMRPRCFQPDCTNFGDYEFRLLGCPAIHAVPVARRDR